MPSHHLRFTLPALCIAAVAWVAACSNGGSGADSVLLPELEVSCDWGTVAGKASECGTSASLQFPDITARIKLSTATCDGSTDGTLALATSTVDCYSGTPSPCEGTIDSWTTADGGSAVTELDAGEYLADIFIDTDDGGGLDSSDATSCTEFTLETGLDTVTADFWTDLP